jgi:sensor domain CHASE-containing protein
VLAVAVMLAVALDGLYRGRLRRDQRAEIQATASGLGNALASALNHRMALLNGLRAFVEIHADRPGFRDDFTVYATRLHGGVSGIRAVQWVQRGVIQQSFPLAGNEATIGYNLLADPRAFIREEYRRAEQGTGIVISGPAELVQGGLGLIARMPARDPAGRLLAVVAVVIDLPPLFAEAGLDDNATVQVGLRAQEIGVFAGTDAVFGVDPILVSVPVADGRWDLAVAPAPGWAGAIQSQVTLAQLVLALVVLLATFSAWLIDSRGRARAREVAERERRLGEEKFARLFALSPDAAFLTRLRDEVVLEANDGVAAMLGTSRDAVVGQTLGDLMQQVTSNDWLTAIRAVRDQGTVRSTPIQFRSGTGQVRHGLYAGIHRRTVVFAGRRPVHRLGA